MSGRGWNGRGPRGHRDISNRSSPGHDRGRGGRDDGTGHTRSWSANHPAEINGRAREREGRGRGGRVRGRGHDATTPRSGRGGDQEVQQTIPPSTILFNDNHQAVQELRSCALEHVGFDVRRQQVSERTNNERFAANYGVSATTVHALLVKLTHKHPKVNERDFLMGLNFLKLY